MGERINTLNYTRLSYDFSTAADQLGLPGVSESEWQDADSTYDEEHDAVEEHCTFDYTPREGGKTYRVVYDEGEDWFGWWWVRDIATGRVLCSSDQPADLLGQLLDKLE